AARAGFFTDTGVTVRMLAAQAAARLGAGDGKGARFLSDDERARWRRRAFDWLKADLEERRRQTGAQPRERLNLLRYLNEVRYQPAFEGLRAPAALAKLPAAEREALSRFWAEVDGLFPRPPARKEQRKTQ